MKNKVIVFGFVMILLSVLVATAMLEDREFSDMENRYLTQKPEFSMEALLNGEYMQDVENYLADQIAGKDSFVAMKTDTEKLLNRQGTNGVFFGKKGQYVKEYKPNEMIYEKTLSLMDRFASYYKGKVPVTMVLAPNVQSIYKDCLPKDITMADADKDYEKAISTLKNITVVDPRKELKKHNSEYLYYRTDHHWTMRGAYYAYETLAKELDWKYEDLSQYEQRTVSEKFYGSLYSKAPLSFAKADSLETFSNVLGKYRVTFEDGSRVNSLFMNTNLYIKDKYTYFLDGNHPFMTIESNAKKGKKALVLKDSYSHNLLPFVADQYDKMDVVDLRYYRGDINQLIEEGQYDDVLMIYNMDFLTTDENFIGLATPIK